MTRRAHAFEKEPYHFARRIRAFSVGIGPTWIAAKPRMCSTMHEPVLDNRVPGGVLENRAVVRVPVQDSGCTGLLTRSRLALAITDISIASGALTDDLLVIKRMNLRVAIPCNNHA